MEELDKKILSLLDSSQVMALGTSVGDNPSAANVFFANEGFDLYFFTFNPTRKQGKGAASLDGRLIDLASVRQATVMVQKAELINKK